MARIYGFGVKMWVLYLAGIKIYGLIIRILSLFNDKARKWAQGRRRLLQRIAGEVDTSKPSIWFHFASLGEFEQGRSVLEAMRACRPDLIFVITFYSPSGYEIRKNTPLADHVYYLPEDTPGNARRFIQLIHPKLAIFTKYEYWPFFFRELATQNVPLYLISAIFRPNQVFFKGYGGFFRSTLRKVTHFFTQNEESQRLLAGLGINEVTVTGDTRFDRVVELPQTHRPIPEVEAIVDSHPILVAGSTWPADEELLVHVQRKFPEWKIIIAPHEIHEEHLRAIEKLFPEAIRFSKLKAQISTEGSIDADKNRYDINHLKAQILLIDNIGMLSSLYAYGHIAYIGGGFGVGIHNTLEAATYGIPVIFGPNYHNFQEAKDLVARGAGFSIQNTDELITVFGQLTNEQTRNAVGALAGQYVKQQAGATAAIMRYLSEKQ